MLNDFLSPRVLELFRDKCVNLSHVDVKQQSGVQSQCNIKAVIERGRMIVVRHTLELGDSSLFIMLPF